jgi:hypothetical protein
MKLPRRKVWDLAGESQVNDDGTPRQNVLRVLYPGEPLTLQRQPDNPFDANAIAVMAGNHAIGFIARADAATLAPLLDAGEPYRAQLHELTGGMPDYPYFGAKVCIAWRDHKMLEPLPLSADQIKHASMIGKRAASGQAAGQSGGKTSPIWIVAIVAFVSACILVAALL